ncbi:MAG: DNRLRE domain-containing protein, partial [Candidatus Heimdallarchaeota archaeon]|nr:DNRLRE domain-containing protein [Candidatus Heimdallarchaeota archaeon]
MTEKRDVLRYVLLGAIAVVLISIVLVLRGGPTGYAVYYEGPVEGQTTLMLQIADSDNLGDSYTISGTPNINAGSNEELHLTGGTGKRYPYLNFNLSGIPSNQIIDNAELCLYLFNDADQILNNYVHHVYIGFDESILTWNNQPCGIGFDDSGNCNLTAEDSITTDGNQEDTWQCFNILNSINNEYSNGDENISLVLYTSDGSNNYDRFHSKEYSDETLRPYLNITYHTANTAPTINLVAPSKGDSYGYNTGLALDFSVYDSDDNIDSCWYNINAGVNVTLVDCANITFDIAEGNHDLNIYVNDSLGLSVGDSASFSVAVGSPSIFLDSPIDVYFNNGVGIEFDYTPTDVDLDSCWLLGDFTGTYLINQTDTSVTSGVINTFILNLGDGEYLWNVGCNDSVGNSAVNGNKTFYVDSINPVLGLSEPVGEKTSRIGIIFDFSVSDFSPLTCYYNITTSIGTEIVNGVEVSGCLDTSFDVSADGDYIIYLWVVDSAGNSESANSSFSVDSSVVSPPSVVSSSGGGSSGGGSFILPNQTGKMEVS